MVSHLKRQEADDSWNYNRCWLPSTPAQPESLLPSLEQAARGFAHYMNADKTEFISFKAISTLNDKPMKLVNQFTYLRNNISSTESDVNLLIGKAWTSIDWLSII